MGLDRALHGTHAKASAHVRNIRLLHVVRAILILLALAPISREAGARVPTPHRVPGAERVPMMVRPLAGERVPESTGRFVVTSGDLAKDTRVVIARFPFSTAGWKSVPSAPAWTVLPCDGRSLELAPLSLAGGVDTPLYAALFWTDARTGDLRVSDVREFTLVPNFANRVAPDGRLQPSAMGRLVGDAAKRSGRRAIELFAGYSLEPGKPAPELPARLKRAAVANRAGDAREAYLVQFGDDSPKEARSRIAAAGGAMVSPIAGDAYLVRLTDDAAGRLAASAGEPWISPYEPAYKLSPAINIESPERFSVTALLFDDGDDQATAAALRSLGALDVQLHSGTLNHLVRFELDGQQLAAAAALADVAWIEPSPRDSLHNDLASWVTQSGVPSSRPIWDRGIRGQGQVVMTSDSGIRTNHELFGDSTLSIAGWGDFPTHRKIIAYKPASSAPEVEFGDDALFTYHGSHTAGTVAGDASATSGLPYSGMAKDAKLYFMDLSGPSGGGRLFPPADLNDLFAPSYAGNAAGAARVSSNSWGSSGAQGAYTISSMQVDQFAWSHPDYLLAFSSGNTGAFATVNSPATAKNCLTVGATGNGSYQNQIAPFSSRGPARDGRRKPTVVGPGVDVISAYGTTRYTYLSMSGTSMATPAVAGSMALVRQYLTEGWYPTGAPVAANAMQPSSALLRAMAVAAARNDVLSFRAPDNSIGYGRVTVDDVLYFPGDSTRTLLIDTDAGLAHHEYVEYQVQVSDPSRPLKIALCWTDAPGNPASQVQIVNDLDLVVTNGSSTYLGNSLLNNISVPGGRRDSLNVEEFVRLAVPVAGIYTVRVEGRNVALGPQPFALCITGGVGGPTGAVALDRFHYGLNDTLSIEVIDADATGPLTAVASSGTEQWNELVTLTGGNGVYRASLPIAPVAPQLGDGVLSVSSGDVVTVSYSGSGSAVHVAATATVNVQSPTISNVRATALSGTQAAVSWTTDVQSSSRVHFGAAGPLATVVDSSGYALQHAVLIDGLTPGMRYDYDVESVAFDGESSRDSLGGAHRSFTTRTASSLALLMDDDDASVLATWNAALVALGWEADVMPAAANNPPLVGSTAAGLRHYNAVMWQVGQNNYPPFSDAQRVAVDSLLNGGGRLLVTGHDIGFGLSDASTPSYSVEREEWLESGLKSRYYFDNLYASTLTGVADDPLTGAFVAGVPFMLQLYADSGDNVGPAPGTDGTWVGDWKENFIQDKFIGMHWESNGAKGNTGAGVWGGEKSRLVGMFYEWRALGATTTASVPSRTNILQRSVSWLLGHNPPEVHVTSPVPGAVVTADFVPIRYSIAADAGRTITSRLLEYSLDAGDSWAPVTTAAYADSGCIWDLAGALGGAPVPNSARVMLRVRVADDGSPVLRAYAVTAGTFTLARAGGDARGPVLLSGSASCSPLPVRYGRTETLYATFSDAETGGGSVSAAEYSMGSAPAAAGSGSPMAGTFGGMTAQVSAALAYNGVTSGELTIWLRGRDGAGNWGPAVALTVPAIHSGTTDVDGAVATDFLAPPSPNPFQGSAAIRFGLARAGQVQLELFDAAGRRVRSLASGVLSPGTHVALWDGRDQQGGRVSAGLYFVRLVTPDRTFHSRVVSLN